ncbi:shikimate dehydrogenase family protein [Halomonas urumqiensis]|uniref:Shikimate dehydrogenase n=1 Tax=Halomonas urumqiensis TaxID=1684789 RepID=A0A2N7UJ30_9GAMM|nr:shikimate dehydrogenase [Halomonas urumqiensis]PMR80446.1 shikimate dehydrogenase [Halomonas urumqiensis]PTB01709.1 shikimate dehydrogenase [Halomonas urumqiensis]GHE22198.1 shikimate dehydrogenase [Halomonas urumqiensis]
MIEQLDGATRLYLVLGDPIAQVKSPLGVTQSMQKEGRNALLAPLHIASDALDAFISGASLARNLDGLIVTVPHKFAAHGHCAAATERANFLGAVNVMRRDANGCWYGDQVDGLAYVAALMKKGFEPRGCSALMAGAGGAGSAIAEALVQAGVARLSIHDEDTARRDALITRLAGLELGEVTIGSRNPTGFDLVINATPCGMAQDDPLPFELAGLSPKTLAGDVITAPEITPWLAAASERGCHTLRGVEMFAAVRDLMVDFLLEDKET